MAWIDNYLDKCKCYFNFFLNLLWNIFHGVKTLSSLNEDKQKKINKKKSILHDHIIIEIEIKLKLTYEHLFSFK